MVENRRIKGRELFSELAREHGVFKVETDTGSKFQAVSTPTQISLRSENRETPITAEGLDEVTLVRIGDKAEAEKMFTDPTRR